MAPSAAFASRYFSFPVIKSQTPVKDRENMWLSEDKLYIRTFLKICTLNTMLYREPFLHSDGVLVTVYTWYKINQQPLQITNLGSIKTTCHVSLSLLVMDIPEMEFMKVKFRWGFWAYSWDFSDLNFLPSFLSFYKMLFMNKLEFSSLIDFLVSILKT